MRHFQHPVLALINNDYVYHNTNKHERQSPLRLRLHVERIGNSLTKNGILPYFMVQCSIEYGNQITTDPIDKCCKLYLTLFPASNYYN